MLRLAALLWLIAGIAAAEELRVMSFNTGLSRNAPGALLTAIEREAADVLNVAAIIGHLAPDILLLQEFDYDPEGRALAAFRALLQQKGLDYPYHFAAAPNAGYPSDQDLDGDGLLGGAADARGFGRYPGHYGMAVLSRHPFGPVRSFRAFAWADLPGARLPDLPVWHSAAAQSLPLSSKSHWDLAVEIAGARLHLLLSHPTPPVFDGPEDRNGRRNADEIRFWTLYLSGTALRDDAGQSAPAPKAPVLLMGDLNLDPEDGEGDHGAIRALLAHPRLQDPPLTSLGGALASAAQGGANLAHKGDPARDTADWRDHPGPGNLRVDYLLPDKRLRVRAGGVFWPAPDAPEAEWIRGRDGSDHRPVWVDLNWP